jgi:phospholipase/carboxylesterase
VAARTHGSWLLALCLWACASSPSSEPALETLDHTIGEGDGPVVVLLHGYGSQPEHFLGLVDRTDLPAGTHLVLPRAPLAIPHVEHGTMWWPLPRHYADIPLARLPGMDAARLAVSALLDRVADEHPGRPIVLGGFSQGAMVSLDVALHDSRPLAGLALLSGTLIDERETTLRLDRLRGHHVFVSHGTSDDVLDYATDARLVDLMHAHGVDVEFTTFEGGHVVTPEISRSLAEFIRRCVAPR